MSSSVSPTASEKVLIIDDELGLRNMLKFGLQKRGYEVFTADGGEQALALAQSQTFHLAVCDIMMPGMDGVEVLKALKGLSPTTEVVMATGFATLETAVESMKQGAFDYITKPYSLANLCAIFEKATERRKLKAKVNHLEEIDRLKNEFIHTMNHELRTPLASIMGYVTLTRQGVYGPLNDKQSEAMGRAEANAKNLMQLIGSVLDFSKLQADRMTLNSELFLLEDLVLDVASVVEPLAGQKKLKFSIDHPDNVSLFCDRVRLRQVLLNLAGNAVKFTTAGSVTIQISLTNDDDGVCFRICDTGVGIAANDISQLFQEFRQIDGSATRHHMGTGLGLAISKRLTELMGGTIAVQSTPGAGSVFILTLPIRRNQPMPLPAEGLTVIDAPTDRIILAIDDDADVLKLLADSIGGAGFRMVTAKSGPEGLALARRLRPDCITLDLMMPHMDGWQVLHALKNDPVLKSIPVYILSMVEEQARAFALGIAGYIQKPFTRDELIAQLALVERKTQQVMVLDDDASIRDVLTAALSSEGYDVVPVSTGEEALSRMKTLSPDVLFLDLGLPGISGFDLLAVLDEQPNRDNVSVVIMTGKDLTEDQQKYLNRRSEMVVQKGKYSILELVGILKKKLPSLKAA